MKTVTAMHCHLHKLHLTISAEFFQLRFTLLQTTIKVELKYVTVSGKTGLIAHLKVSRNVDFKYSVCCSWPMVVATHT